MTSMAVGRFVCCPMGGELPYGPLFRKPQTVSMSALTEALLSLHFYSARWEQ